MRVFACALAQSMLFFIALSNPIRQQGEESMAKGMDKGKGKDKDNKKKKKDKKDDKKAK